MPPTCPLAKLWMRDPLSFLRVRCRGALVVLAMVSTGCAGGSGAFSGPPPLRTGPPVTYVALGEQLPSSVTDPRMLWQDLFAQSALPVWATTYVVAVPEDWPTAPAALARQVAALRPTLVSVDVGLDEAVAGEEASVVSSSLRELLAALEHVRVRTILVADLPPTPDRSGGLPTAMEVAAYDSAIAADCKAVGAVLVDIHRTLTRAASSGAAVSTEDGLTARGETLVAAAFEAAVKSRLRGLVR